MLAIALGRFQLQVFPAFLERGFNRPPLCITLHDLLRAQAQIRREKILVTMGPRTIMDVYPTDFNEGFPDAVPIKFIPIKPSVAMALTARESYAAHSRLP